MNRVMQKSFLDPHLGVFCCGHVFRRERLVRLVMRLDGDWQFLCGGDDHQAPERPHHVHVGALVAHDPSLSEVSDLPAEWEAERTELGSPWVRTHGGATDA